MGNINFTDFDLLTANGGDFLVGHDSAGTKEIKVQVNSLLSLVQPPTNFLRKSGDTVGGKLFSIQVNPNQFTVDTEFTTKRYVDFMANKATNDAIVSLGDFSNALRPINGVITSTFPVSTLNTEVIVAGTRAGYGLRILNNTNFDPNVTLTVDGRARVTHVMTFQAGIPNFTNGSDHSHVLWSTQGNRLWQMIQNGGTDSSENVFSQNQMFSLVTVGDGMGGVFYNELPVVNNIIQTNLHSVDTTNLVTTPESRQTFPYPASNLTINFNTSAALVEPNAPPRPLNINEPVQLNFNAGFAGIVASTFPGRVTSGPIEVTINGETKWKYTFEFTGLDNVHWLPTGQARFALNMPFGNIPGLRVLVSRRTIQGTQVGLSGNYMNIPRYVLVEQTNHNAFVGSPIVLSIVGSPSLTLPAADYNGFVKDVIDENHYVLSLGNHYLFPTTSGTAESQGWVVYVGSTDAIHQYNAALQHINFRRFKTRPTQGGTIFTGGSRSVAIGNSSETDGYFTYAIGYNSSILNLTNGPILTASSAFGGAYSVVQGSYSTAVGGRRIKITKDNQTVFGQFNNPNTDAIVVVGGGTDEQNRTNALELSGNGIFKLPSSAFQTVGEDTYLKILGPNNENYGLKLELLP